MKLSRSGYILCIFTQHKNKRIYPAKYNCMGLIVSYWCNQQDEKSELSSFISPLHFISNKPVKFQMGYICPSSLKPF